MIVERRGELTLYRSELLRSSLIDHAFSTRIGGVSTGPFASLNLSADTGDDRNHVIENRSRLCAALDAPFPPAVPRQVLGSNVVTPAEIDQKADAIVSNERGRSLLTFSADCVLILLWDRRHLAVGNVHSSRHGTREEIVKKAMDRMSREFETVPRDLLAAIGPSIGPCCYEIGPDVADLWRGRFLRTDGGRMLLDLWAATRAQLEEHGVPPEQIDEARVCTKCRPEHFFSYRRDGGRTGRFGALIWIR